MIDKSARVGGDFGNNDEADVGHDGRHGCHVVVCR